MYGKSSNTFINSRKTTMILSQPSFPPWERNSNSGTSLLEARTSKNGLRISRTQFATPWKACLGTMSWGSTAMKTSADSLGSRITANNLFLCSTWSVSPGRLKAHSTKNLISCLFSSTGVSSILMKRFNYSNPIGSNKTALSQFKTGWFSFCTRKIRCLIL